MQLASRFIWLAIVAAIAALAVFIPLQSHAQPSPYLGWLDRVFSTGSTPLRTTPDALLSWLQEGQPRIDLSGAQGEAFTQVRRNFIRKAEHEARRILGGGDAASYVHPPVKADAYPYWSFIPQFLAGIIPDGPTVAWNASATSCFQSNSATLTPNADGATFTLSVTVSEPSSFLCSDFYLFATLDGLILHTFSSEGQTNFTWTLAQQTPALQWDLETKGVRVFRFTGGLLQMLGNVIDTALLFEGEFTQGVSPAAAARNVDFLQKYAGVDMTLRQNVTEIILDESEIQSGDFFGIMRLDGMDPMLAWAMGSSTGHVTTALWIGGQLYICESTAKGAHWPVNGIQKTPYRQWLAQVKAAGQQAVHAALTPEARARYNETAALEWFLQQEGLDYGYHTLLWGWLDIGSGPDSNYPCLPPTFEVCLGWEAFEVVFGWMDAWLPSVGDLLFNQAFNFRLGTQGLQAPELFQLAVEQGYQPDELPTIPEQDEWIYNTTRYGSPAEGRSLVCCVFVCSMWKAAGVFGPLTDSIQCGELTNWDDYTMAVLEAPKRPQACIDADPDNPLCQIEGVYTLQLGADFASKPLYANMAETCGGHAPDYERPDTC